MGYGILHQSNAPGGIGAIFARSKNSGCCGEKIGVVECGLVWDVRRVLSDLLYLKIRRGTQVAQGRGLQNLHSWVRIPPAPPGHSLYSPERSFTERSEDIVYTPGPNGFCKGCRVFSSRSM